MRQRNIVTLGTDYGLGKLPPQAIDLEEAVLGAIILEKHALNEVADFLKVETFYLEKHQTIYVAILDLVRKSEPIDIRTVTNKLRESNQLEGVGGAYYVADLTTKVQSAANIETHARILLELSIKRQLITLGTALSNECYQNDKDALNCLENAMGSLIKLSEGLDKRTGATITDILPEVITNIKSAIDSRSRGEIGITGIPSGFETLDKATGGWQKKDFIIIAGRPGMGKTTLALESARKMAYEHKRPGVFFSLEMGKEQLVKKMVASNSTVTTNQLTKGNLNISEQQTVFTQAMQLGHEGFIIDDSSALSIFELRAKAFRYKAKYKIEWIIIDYLQLMRGEGLQKNANRDQEIGQISRGLKQLAKELDVPIIALAQLSREVERRADKKPMLSDLRESGNLEQDTDMVIFAFRPEYYGITEATDDKGQNMPTANLMWPIIAKHRNGGCYDNLVLGCDMQFSKIYDLNAPEEKMYIQKASDNGAFPDVKSQQFKEDDYFPVSNSSEFDELFKT